MSGFLLFISFCIIFIIYILLSKKSEKRKKFDSERGIDKLKIEREELLIEINMFKKEKGELKESVDLLKTEDSLYDVGFYESNYDFEDSIDYKEMLLKNRGFQEKMILDKKAVKFLVSAKALAWSEKNPKKIVDNHVSLILRAFNGECDSAVLKVNYKNIEKFERLIKRGKKI
jgi:hypothetical protein